VFGPRVGVCWQSFGVSLNLELLRTRAVRIRRYTCRGGLVSLALIRAWGYHLTPMWQQLLPLTVTQTHLLD
jgi:hypothetical protein